MVNFIATAFGNDELVGDMGRWERQGLREYPKNKPFADMTARLGVSEGERSVKGFDSFSIHKDNKDVNKNEGHKMKVRFSSAVVDAAFKDGKFVL